MRGRRGLTGSSAGVRGRGRDGEEVCIVRRSAFACSSANVVRRSAFVKPSDCSVAGAPDHANAGSKEYKQNVSTHHNAPHTLPKPTNNTWRHGGAGHPRQHSDNMLSEFRQHPTTCCRSSDNILESPLINSLPEFPLLSSPSMPLFCFCIHHFQDLNEILNTTAAHARY